MRQEELGTMGIRKLLPSMALPLVIAQIVNGMYNLVDRVFLGHIAEGGAEILTGVDLVKWQIRIAAGVPIPFSRSDIRLTGAAIECRINALTPGMIKTIHVPGGPFVRFDTYLEPGTFVPPYYDSLIGKLIVFTATREEAIRKMKAYLCELVIDGVKTNIEEELSIIGDPRFESGRYDTGFMEGR